MTRDVIISIHPFWIERIFCGAKTVEIRKSAPKFSIDSECNGNKKKNFTAFIYATKNPVPSYPFCCSVVGKMEISCCIKKQRDFSEMDNYWDVDELVERSCLSVDQIVKYSNNGTFYAWCIGKVIPFKWFMSLSDFGLKRPPQSWQYVKE